MPNVKSLEQRARERDRALAKADERSKAKRAPRKSAETAPDAGPSTYGVQDGRLIWQKPTKDGATAVTLANFDARISEEITRDDGLAERLQFVIRGTLADGASLAETAIPAERYAAMNWVTSAWGSRALVHAGMAIKDHLRVAIQSLSDPTRRHVYAHSGWRRIGGVWYYLHGGGAIGAEGLVESVSVDLPRNLDDFRLPPPPDDPRANIRAALRLLDMLPDPIGAPCLLAPVRALLSEAAAVDFALHFSGTTGGRKSETAGVLQNFFGHAWHGKHLPAGWVGTSNSNERLAFAAKDALLTVDDFCPRGTPAEQAKLQREADRLLRAAGNRQGRGRMNADGSFRETYFPRGLILSTGEDIPQGQSLRGRLLILEFEPDMVNLEILTALQQAAAAGALAGFTAALIRWLAPRMDDLEATLPARAIELRAQAAVQGHARTPDIVAGLYAAAEVLAEFAAEHDIELDRSRIWNALLEAGRTQAQHQTADDPVRRFLDLIRSALASGRAHLADAERPDDELRDAALGWRRREVGSGEFTRHEWQPQGERIGWVDQAGAYLDPDSAYAAVQRMGRDQNSGIALGAQTLWKRLRERGMLATTDPGRTTARKTIGDKRHRILHLTLDAVVKKSGPSGPSGPPPYKNNGLDPENVDRYAEKAGHGHKTKTPMARFYHRDGPIFPKSGPRKPCLTH